MDKMIEERSAGILIYREADERKYLLLNYPAGHWDYPKGHIEGSESEKETALRELVEETGIEGDEVELKDDFRETIDYFYRKRGDLSHKKVIFFLGKTIQDEVELSEEHEDYTWLPFEKAMKKLTFQNAKRLLNEAQKFIGDKET